ncbi:MAG TPA: hypothetical protein PLL76_19135 [Thermoanaerobaculia bacterium]|jgi:hypothetical protein|nr:hypothetical protein [Thermoanaerobaculia bacterium]
MDPAGAALVAAAAAALGVIVGLGVTGPVAAAESDTRIAVSVNLSGRDSAGVALAYRVREELRRSRVFREASRKDALLHIDLVTLDPDADDAGGGGRRTVAAVAFMMTNLQPFKKGDPQTWRDISFGHLGVRVVGISRVEQVAASIVATLDEELSRYREETQE